MKLSMLLVAIFILSLGCFLLGPTPLDLDWKKLFIEVDDLPTGWSRGGIYEHCISSPLDSGCNKYQAKSVSYWSSGDSEFMIEIRFYEDEKSASNDYYVFSERFFGKLPDSSEFLPPSAVTFYSSIAEKMEYACGQITLDGGEENTNCCYTAQYDRYLIATSVMFKLTPDYDLFKMIMELIDRKMWVYEPSPPILDGQQ